jgi:uncharacterized DUF497 family protein
VAELHFMQKYIVQNFALLLELINCPIKTVQKYLKFNEDNTFEITMNRVFFQTLKHFGHFIIIILGTMHIQGLWLIVFNATFNNISVISWRSVSLVEETEYQEKGRDLPQVTDKLYHILLYRIHLDWAGFKLTTLVVIITDCISTNKCSYKSNYHTITTPRIQWFLPICILQC